MWGLVTDDPFKQKLIQHSAQNTRHSFERDEDNSVRLNS